MSVNEPLQYIEKIVLEIIDRPWFWFHQWRARHTKKFNLARFNAREAAYAFLRQYNGEPFIKAQKITVWYDNEELHLCVRNLIYGTIDTTSKRAISSAVEFIYQQAMFSEVKWPVITVNRTNRVRWASDNNEQTFEPSLLTLVPSLTNEPTNADIGVVPCNNLDYDQSLPVNSTPENISNSSCQVRQSVSGLQRLITDDNGSLTLGHTMDDESHFRSSIHIHVNQIKNNP